jgi:peptidoglycan/LPS O-acetylase OafA/YrhL
MKDEREEFATALRRKLALPQIPALNGIRAVAVFLVIFYHYGLRLPGNVKVPGAHGVLIFFVMSGFLITWLLLKESEKYGRISLKAFYRRRVLRIFPAFYFYWILLVAILLLGGHQIVWLQTISSFLYLSNYYQAIFGDPNNAFSHTWSLAIEEQFYLFWPFLFATFRHDLKKMTLFLVGLIGSVWIHRCVLYFVFGASQEYFYAAFDTRLDSLMVGCLLAVLLKRGVLMRFWERVCRGYAIPVLTVMLFVASVFAGPLLIPRYRDFVGLAIDPLLVAVIIVQAIALSSTWLFKWMEWGWVRFLGQISYSLYLYQQLTLQSVHNRLTGQPEIVQLCAAITVTIFAACFSFYVIERPFLKLKDRKTEGPVEAPVKDAAQPSPVTLNLQRIE